MGKSILKEYLEKKKRKLGRVGTLGLFQVPMDYLDTLPDNPNTGTMGSYQNKNKTKQNLDKAFDYLEKKK